eukprot:4879_1
MTPFLVVMILIHMPLTDTQAGNTEPPVVIDISSRVATSGFADEDSPRSTILMDSNSMDISQLLAIIFDNELLVDASEHAVFITVNTNISEEDKQTLTEILFAIYRVPQLYVQIVTEGQHSVWIGASMYVMVLMDRIPWLYLDEYCATNGNCDAPSIRSTTVELK